MVQKQKQAEAELMIVPRPSLSSNIQITPPAVDLVLTPFEEGKMEKREKGRGLDTGEGDGRAP